MRIAWRHGLFLSFSLTACAPGQVAPAAPSVASGAGSDLGAEAGAPPTPAPASGSAEARTGFGVDAGRPHVHDPGRAAEDIRAIVIAHRDEARACYEKSLIAHPGIEGDLVMRWTVDPKGAVTQVSNDVARSQIVEPSVVACIADILMKIQFAPSQRGFETKAFYPFNFHPRRGLHDGGAP
jgi:hypothetical protein